MAEHPNLIFCPYLPVHNQVEFAGWRLGPPETFENEWGDPRFKEQATAFLGKFVDGYDTAIKHPALIGRVGVPLDGQMPKSEEIDALQAAIEFGFLDNNPRHTKDAQGWQVTTSDNTEVFVWPIDLEEGHVTVAAGKMVRTMVGGFQIQDQRLRIRAPLELHLPLGVSADSELFEAVYLTCFSSSMSPGANSNADRLRTALRWFGKAWRNTASVGFDDRVVFLKTGFEALTGTSKSREVARRLRALFESLPNTDSEDAEDLIWSPTEMPVHPHSYKGQTENLTSLEHWFKAFADARNAIIHDGLTPSLAFSLPGSRYDGHFVHVSEALLRAAAKASLSTVGYPDIWRPATWRAVKKAFRAHSGSA